MFEIDVMDKKAILCLGHAVLDQIYFMDSLPTAGKYFANTFIEVGGGPAATASVAVAKLGHASTLWTRLGNDRVGNLIQAELKSYGVNLESRWRFQGVASAVATVVVDAKGERMIIGFLDPQLLQENPDGLPLEQVKNFACVLVDMRWPGAAAGVLKEATRHGIPSVTDADLAPDPLALHELTPLSDHAIFSEGGLKQYTGKDSPEAGLRLAAERMPGVPYVTLGGHGCMWWNRGSSCVEFFPAFRVAVKDTTGAGDVFHGAFAVALVEGKNRREAVCFASAVAALKCTGMGGRSAIPDRESVNTFLGKFNLNN